MVEFSPRSSFFLEISSPEKQRPRGTGLAGQQTGNTVSHLHLAFNFSPLLCLDFCKKQHSVPCYTCFCLLPP